PNYVIESVVMSKYHMAILTSDSSHNLLVCGFGRGGRLGLGKDLETQFIPVAVPWPERIVSVALGRDHTVAVTESGHVITFGSNDMGQLGYETDHQDQLVPRKIQAQSLKKQPILGAAASRIHSVVFTLTDIFTFGLNQGQLGYHQPDHDPCQTTPRKVSMSTEIVQVVANDNATAVLNKSHEVILLCNYNQQKLFFPIHRFPKHIVVHRSEPNYAVKLISSGSEYLGAVTNTGDVFIWTCRSLRRNSEQMRKACATNKQTTIISAPKPIWALHKAHHAAIDASIGQHGEIVICTVSGHVFVGRNEANGYKFSPIPHLQRCIKVCANLSGAFAAIRSEYVLPALTTVLPSTLEHDLAIALPHMNIAKELQSQLRHTESLMELEVKSERHTRMTATIEDDEAALQYQQKRETMVKQKHHDMMLSFVNEAWDRIDIISRQDDTLDIVFMINDKRIYCHSSLLQCRSRLFRQLIDCVDRTLDQQLTIKVKKREADGRIEIHIDQCQTASLLLLLDYVYTDTYEHPMKAFFKLPPLCFEGFDLPSSAMVKSVQKDLVTLANLFDLPLLISSAQSSFGHTPVPSLKDSLKQLKEKRAEISILTKDSGQTLNCHRIILRQRCPFFSNLFKPQSVWIQTRKEQNKQAMIVNLDHMTHDIMKIILDYIYLDKDESSLFDEIEQDKEESMMKFLLELLCEADYLLLERLKTITEKALVRFIKLRSAPTIADYANTYLADNLKKACLQFISVNLPVFLRANMLDTMAVSLVRDLEAFVRQLQMVVMPLVPKGNYVAPDDDQEALLEEEDTEFSSSMYALSRGDGSTTPKETAKKSSPPLPSTPAENSNKTKRDTRISLESLEPQQEKRQPSASWAPVAVNEATSTTKLSLREIIETENKPVEAKTNSKAVMPKKISQKERKRLVHQQEVAAAMESSSSTSRPVWGKLPVIDVKPILKNTEFIKDTSIPLLNHDGKGKKVYISQQNLNQIEVADSNSRQPLEPKKPQVLFNPTESLGSTFKLTPIRRFNFNKESTQANVERSFQSIQKQQELEDNWIKGDKPKKNILRIQKEEQAVTSIGQYYVQTLEIMSGEWCEVQRITTR
ncbi:hypothetical protein CU098_000354, partial [Rhizopus stolonifer]